MTTLLHPVITSPVITDLVEVHVLARRAHVSLMEPDPALRSVLTRTLLRAGCVVIFRRTLEQASAALAQGAEDALVVALDDNPRAAIELQKRNSGNAQLIVLTAQAVDPRLLHQLPSVRFHQKPFDTRDLLDDLGISRPSSLDR